MSDLGLMLCGIAIGLAWFVGWPVLLLSSVGLGLMLLAD